MSGLISSSLTESVKYWCSNTDTEDLGSAVSVFNDYCSAAAGKIKDVVSVTRSTTSNSAEATSGQGSGGSEPTSSSGSTSTSGSGGSSNGDNGNNDLISTTGLSKGAIIGIAVGIVIVALLAIGVLAWCIRTRHQRNKLLAAQQGANFNGGAGGIPNNNNGGGYGQQQPVELVPTKSELMGDEVRMLTPGSGYSKETQNYPQTNELQNNEVKYNYNNPNNLQSPGGYSSNPSVSPMSPGSQYASWQGHPGSGPTPPPPHQGAVELNNEVRANELPGGWQAQGGQQGQHGWQQGSDVRYEMDGSGPGMAR